MVALLLVLVHQYMGLNELRDEKAKAQNVGLESQLSDGFVPCKLHFADEEQVPEQRKDHQARRERYGVGGRK